MAPCQSYSAALNSVRKTLLMTSFLWVVFSHLVKNRGLLHRCLGFQ